jgi:hypothetical protein
MHSLLQIESLSPSPACANPAALAQQRDRMPGPALTEGRAMFAECLSCDAEASREAAQ